MSSTIRPAADSHISELDGVRAIAVWMVIFDHALDGWPLLASTLALVPFPIRIVGRYGWLGVDLFFVLSGFLITGILLNTKDNPKYFRNFYGRRALRIIPVYFLVILVCWFFYGAAGTNYFLASFAFLSNFYYPLGLHVPHGPGVFWSLAIEEHFYLFWPLLARFLSRLGLTVLAIAICVVNPIVRWYAINHGVDPVNEVYCITWFRLDGLALGALLAIWSQSRFAIPRINTLKFAGLLFLILVLETVALLPAGIMKSGSPFRYNQAQLMFGAFLMAVLGLRGTAWTAPLRSRFARLSGNLSYCVYLIHLSLGDAYQGIAARLGWHPGDVGMFAARTSFMIVSAFALAMLSRRFIEEPALRLKRYFAY